MKLKNKLLLLLLPFSAFASYGAEDPYKNEKYKDILLEAYNQISLFYPGKTLCVSYEVVIPFMLSGGYTDKGGDQLGLQQYTRLIYRAVNDKPIFSEKLKAYFPDCGCDIKTADYRLEFTIPTKGMIGCNVYPYDGRMGILGGATGYQSFLIRFNDKDGIYHLGKSEIMVD